MKHFLKKNTSNTITHLSVLFFVLWGIGGAYIADSHAQATIAPSPNFKVAFIGDSGDGSGFQSVLNLIDAEGAATGVPVQLVLHQGDFSYQLGPTPEWTNKINNTLGADFPYLGSDGNHDDWQLYADQFFKPRLASMQPQPFATGGDVDTSNYSVEFQGVKIAFIQEGGNVPFIEQEFPADSDYIWKICSWHLNQQDMQVGGKTNQQGWGSYQACQDAGAIIATGHEHSYSRTYTMSDPAHSDGSHIIVGQPDVLQVEQGSPGKSFAFVSGIGGREARDYHPEVADSHGWWATIYTWDSAITDPNRERYCVNNCTDESTLTQDRSNDITGYPQQNGALFITFNVDGDPRKARGEFKITDGSVYDSFTIYADGAAVPACKAQGETCSAGASCCSGLSCDAGICAPAPAGSCTAFASVTVQGTGGSESTPVTQTDKLYKMTATGTYTWGPDQTPADTTDESGVADAEYADTSGFSGNPNGWNNPPSGLDVLINGTDVAWQGSGVPDPAHTYTYELVGNGNSITLNIDDSDTSDNSGSLTVSVEECPLPSQPPTADTCPDIVCKADLNCSGMIESTDFTLLMFYWGDPAAKTKWLKEVDFDVDGSVDIDELGIILSNWKKQTTVAECSTGTGNPPIAGPASALSYPRTSGWFFGQTDIPEWLAQYDLVYTNKLSTAVAQNVKSIDPDILMIASVYDWNTFSNQADRLPREWLVRDHTGADVCAYGSGTRCTRLIDISMHAPQIQVGRCSNDGGDICADNSDCSSGATCQGISGPAIRYNEFIADRTINAVDLSVWDGVATHGVWDRPRENPVDLDRNGQNDWDEHGSTTSWLRNNWLPGVEFTVNRIRSAIGPDKILHLNSGRFHNPGSSGTGNDVPWTGSNGLSMEEESGFTSFRFFKNAWDDFRGVANLPYTIMLDSQPSSRDPFKPADDRNYYRFMRGMLTTSLYGDGFFSFTDLADKGTHHYELYFDEYNTDLGQPTGLMQLVRSTGGDDEGVYVRFFDNGAVIANISRSPQVVTDADISTIAGYSGPYYRFQGGQNPVFNDGSQFSSVSLEGGEFCVNDACGNKRIVGDGIILLKNPTTVVADIIIDNIRQYTSPGTNPVSVVGSWTDECGTDHWSIRCAPWRDEHDFKSSVSGGDEAVFTPQIGVAADYDIYEWHGQVNSGSTCTAVQLDIQDATCSSIASTIDQSTNTGQWNHIGTCSFSAGNIGKVSITNPGGCTTIVDAFKFKLAAPDGGTPGPGGSGDTQAPVVTSFSVTSGSTIVDWQVSDTGGSGLKDLNILRYAGTCSEAVSANWSGSNLFTDTISISAVSPGPANHAGTQVQNPPTGTYCYGLRVHDHDGNVGSEQASIEFNAVADAGAGIIEGTRLVDWTHVGYPGSIQCSTSLVDVTTMGIVGDGVTDNAATMQALINDPANTDTFYFPPGTYRFETKLLFDQNTKFRGAGSDQTHLEFALAGDSLPVGTEAIRAVGGEYGAFVNITGLTTKGTTQLQVADTSSFAGKEFVEIQQTNDPTVMGTQRPSNWDEPWAANSQGQIIKIQSINGNTITLDAPLAVDFKAAQNPQARGANLMKGIAIEDLHIKLVDPGADYATILMRGVADSWIRGVESELTSKYHIWVQRSSNIEIRGNYIHDSYSHDGGHGYGVLLNSHTSNVLVEDNIFRYLRHAMIVKEGANTNVIGYNYSIHPHFGDGIDNSSIIPNDLSLHGHYPYMNLFEGNIFNQGGVGDYWGPAGPGNTFVRNKVEPMPSPPFPSYFSHAHLSIEDPSHDQNVVGNEMPHNDILELDVGAGLPQGTLKHGNIIQGNVQWDTAIAERAVPHSYYYTQGAPGFLSGYTWPPFGPINEAGDTNNSSIPAQDRYSGTGNKTVSSGCSIPIVAASGSRDDIQAAVDIALPGETVVIPAGTLILAGRLQYPRE